MDWLRRSATLALVLVGGGVLLAGGAFAYQEVVERPLAETARRARYEHCLSSADAAATKRWDGTCATIAAVRPQALSDCTKEANLESDVATRKLELLRCEEAYRPTPAHGCALPAAQAGRYNALHGTARAECLSAAKNDL